MRRERDERDEERIDERDEETVSGWIDPIAPFLRRGLRMRRSSKGDGGWWEGGSGLRRARRQTWERGA